MRRECRERFPFHRLHRKPLVSDPGMNHGTCVTHVPWCMSGSLSRSGGENVPGIPGTCATHNFTYLSIWIHGCIIFHDSVWLYAFPRGSVKSCSRHYCLWFTTIAFQCCISGLMSLFGPPWPTRCSEDGTVPSPLHSPTHLSRQIDWWITNFDSVEAPRVR